MPPERPSPAPSGRPAAQRLESWKGIAGYLQRDVRTVQRWEKHEGLPVYRHIHGKLSTVYAYGHEIDIWWNSRQHRSLRTRIWLMPAIAVVLLGAVTWAGWRYWSYRIPQPVDLATRRVWAGPDANRLGSVSPNGRYFSYIDSDNRQLALREISTGEERRFTKGPLHWPVFSPGSDRIACSRLNTNLRYELRSVGIHGGQERVLYSNPGWPYVRPYDWSTDGRHILAVLRSSDRRGEIAAINVDDGAVHVLKTLDWRDPLRICFSPDARWVAYDFPVHADSDSRDIYSLEIASGAPTGREVTLVDHPNNDLLLGWAPDGRSILFASDRTGTSDAWTVRVNLGRPQGPAELVKKDLGMVWPMGFTAGGSFLYARQTPMADVYFAPIDVETGRILASPSPATQAPVGSGGSPDWSPDSQYLACMSRRSAFERWPGATVFIHSLKTQQERVIRPKLYSLDHLRWQPGGHAFLATGVDMEGREGLFRIDAQTGDSTPVLQEGGLEAHVHEFEFAAGNRFLVRVTDWDLEPGRLAGIGSAHRFALSPDSRQIAYSTFDESWEFLRVAPAAGGESRELYKIRGGSAHIESVAWSPDGSRIWFARNGALWRVSTVGGPPEELSLRMKGLSELRISPDGRLLAFTAGQGHGEVWEMQHFLPRQ